MKNFLQKVKTVFLVIVMILCFAGFVYGLYLDLKDNPQVEISQDDTDIVMEQYVIDLYY